MKKGIMILALLQMVVGVQAVVYKLERVETLVSGGQYVFINGTKVLDATINDGALQTVDSSSCNFANWDGTQTYVWTVKGSGSDFKMLNNGLGLNIVDPMNSADLEMKNSEYVTNWTFSLNENKRFKMEFTYSGGMRGISRLDNTTHIYKAYSSLAASFKTYRLVAETYEREVTVGVLGTICLPYAVDTVTGADVYQLTCKESDGSGNPNNVYYELVEMPLVAGRPYLFEPTASSVVFHRKDVATVSAPVYNSDGFYGTFTDITGAVLEGKYMLNSQNQFQLCGSNCGLRANRGYFDLSKTPEKQAGQVAQRRMLIVGQNGVEHIEPHNIGTRIDDVNANANVNKVMVGGQLMIIHEGNYYNAQGGRL